MQPRNQPLATLQISGQVDTTRLSAAELKTHQARKRSLYVNAEPSVKVTRNEYSECWLIEARNIELPELIQELSHYCAHPIVCGADVRGTVSATVSAFSMDEALHRLITPFGLTLSRQGSMLTVGSDFPAPAAHDAFTPIVENASVELTAASPIEAPDLEDANVNRQPAVNASATATVAAVAQQNSEQQQNVETADAVKKLIAAGQTNAALRLISSKISEQPTSAFLFRLLGETFAFQADYDRAAVALEHSIKLNKYDPTTSQVFSNVLAQLGQQQRSDHYAQLALDIKSGLVAR